ncbi:protein NRT1/ PTR FAMILY 5.10 [Amborella trichopoda]|uniref:Major facilitator superfamily (MFS) profile domain-containing protein n=1 Tax=Amborella trichopoda TaxID=13333 RepID=W1PCI7_AMBTC|nr:protein NRT1/ PTR FAMILY 5.10 [Amborella trichopoda]ERN04735.1 hypothetical protein AMTR_s00186p00036810 [Amborella trichopoda]|eukprot:XP_006843060.1 protein NRT1/ PTR FAMILY 5.10 [Amborella trichopoda]
MVSSSPLAEDPSSSSPLLHEDVDTVKAAVGGRGRSATGGWSAAIYIIWVEVAERFAYNGASSNMMTYLTRYLHQSTATAAKNVNVWNGVATIIPLLGAFIADSYMGRYPTIIVSSFIYVMGLSMLTLSAILPSLRPPVSCVYNGGRFFCHLPSAGQAGFFFTAIYMVALGQGGHKPCVQAFGADQFDEDNQEERMWKQSFFNWWYFGISNGSLLAVSVMMFVQDNIGWGWGFGIPAVAMAAGLLVFLAGRKKYRLKQVGLSPMTEIAQVFVAAVRKRNVSYLGETESEIFWASGSALPGPLRARGDQFRWLDKAAIPDEQDRAVSKKNKWRLCSVRQVEDAKLLLRLVPIWASCLLYTIVYAQSPTFFTKQGITMDRKLGSTFMVPPAALQTFINVVALIVVPLYDRLIIPMARKVKGDECGITTLQRIGTGIFVSAIAMVVAALVELKRLRVAADYGLLDLPNTTIPMSIVWLIPQYVLFGVADVFTVVGLQEFFYNQMPNDLRSVGAAIYLCVFGLGSLLSSLLISVIDGLSSLGGGESWFSDNINRAHLDYFYSLLALLCTLSLIVYVYFARIYVYKPH